MESRATVRVGSRAILVPPRESSSRCRDRLPSELGLRKRGRRSSGSFGLSRSLPGLGPHGLAFEVFPHRPSSIRSGSIVGSLRGSPLRGISLRAGVGTPPPGSVLCFAPPPTCIRASTPGRLAPSFGRAQPVPGRVPPSQFLATLTGCSVRMSRVCCTPLPVMGFAAPCLSRRMPVLAFSRRDPGFRSSRLALWTRPLLPAPREPPKRPTGPQEPGGSGVCRSGPPTSPSIGDSPQGVEPRASGLWPGVPRSPGTGVLRLARLPRIALRARGCLTRQGTGVLRLAGRAIRGPQALHCSVDCGARPGTGVLQLAPPPPSQGACCLAAPPTRQRPSLRRHVAHHGTGVPRLVPRSLARFACTE